MPYISIKEVSYNFDNYTHLFKNISLSVNKGEKIAIVGDNGVGKSTLFKIILGKLSATSGDVNISGKLISISQIVELKGSVAESLGISERLDAIKRVESGNFELDDFDIIGNDWDIEEQAKTKLKDFSLEYLDLQQDSSILSGGEKVKISLLKLFLTDADFLLLDEPTNNLDLETKEQFSEMLQQFKGGAIVISHDRALLQKMDKIAEFKSDGMRIFGGNYDFYQEIKQKELLDMEKECSSLNKQQKDIKKDIAKKEQKLEKSKKVLKKKFENHKFAPLGPSYQQMTSVANSSNQKNKNKDMAKISKLSERQNELKNKINEDVIKIPLPESRSFKKDLVIIDNIKFGYGNRRIFDNFSLHVSGNSRILLKGKNGAGKSTLVNLILQNIKPENGSVKLNGRVIFLDQSLSLLDKEKSLIDNFLDLNYGSELNDAYKVMANFLFKNVQVEKKVKYLSGGELVKATLACILGTTNQPELLILDEPTNNLDIKSVEILESALRQYQGALIVVSHDELFTKNIDINQEIVL